MLSASWARSPARSRATSCSGGYSRISVSENEPAWRRHRINGHAFLTNTRSASACEPARELERRARERDPLVERHHQRTGNHDRETTAMLRNAVRLVDHEPIEEAVVP